MPKSFEPDTTPPVNKVHEGYEADSLFAPRTTKGDSPLGESLYRADGTISLSLEVDLAEGARVFQEVTDVLEHQAETVGELLVSGRLFAKTGRGTHAKKFFDKIEELCKDEKAVQAVLTYFALSWQRNGNQ